VVLIWEPSLVAEFQNADARLSEKPESVAQSFEREPITAGAVHDNLADLPHEDRLRVFTQYLLGSLKVPNLFGLCRYYGSSWEVTEWIQIMRTFFAQFICTASPV
jgi:hypothetical protein